MNLPDDEAADLRNAHDTGWLTLLAHVADLCDAYRAQGYVMGDLAHDGTLKAQAEAPAQAEAVDGWICEVCGCWNRDGDLCKYGDDEAHQAEAEEDSVEPLQKCLRCLELCEPGFACVDGEKPSCPRPCRPVAEGGRIR